MKTLRQIMTLLVMACIVFASSTAFAASLQDEVLNEVNLERTAAGIQPLSGMACPPTIRLFKRKEAL